MRISPFFCIVSLALPGAALASESIPEVVATIGGAKITREDVMKVAGPQLAKIRQDEYNAVSEAVNRLIEERLVDAAAKKAGISIEDYLKREVEAKIPEPTQAQIAELYEQVKTQRNVQGKSLEEIRPQIVEYLKGNAGRETYEKLIGRLRTESNVVVNLEPPRVKVAEGGNPALGSSNAPVTIIAFTDYECPFCSRAEDTMVKILETYKDKVRVVVRDFPLDFHQNAQKAHEAAGCALEQGKFAAMHEKLFKNQRALQVPQLKQYAEQIGLDAAKFAECLDSGKRASEVSQDLADGSAVGVTGTPAFFVNGQLLSGALPFEDFAKVIDAELERAAKKSAKKS